MGPSAFTIIWFRLSRQNATATKIATNSARATPKPTPKNAVMAGDSCKIDETRARTHMVSAAQRPTIAVLNERKYGMIHYCIVCSSAWYGALTLTLSDDDVLLVPFNCATANESDFALLPFALLPVAPFGDFPVPVLGAVDTVS